MWPFKEKDFAIIELDDSKKENKNEAAITELMERMPIGSMFKYLGIDMRVTKHFSYISCGIFALPIPSIHADYVDRNGIVRSISFNTFESKRLMNDQP